MKFAILKFKKKITAYWKAELCQKLNISGLKDTKWVHTYTNKESNDKWNTFITKLTTKPKTSVRTRSPISGEISEPNCCNVVRKRLSLLSCRAPHAGGSCWFIMLLAIVAGDGVRPLMTFTGEWLPFIPAVNKKKFAKNLCFQHWKCQFNSLLCEATII